MKQKSESIFTDFEKIENFEILGFVKIRSFCFINTFVFNLKTNEIMMQAFKNISFYMVKLCYQKIGNTAPPFIVVFTSLVNRWQSVNVLF